MSSNDEERRAITADLIQRSTNRMHEVSMILMPMVDALIRDAGGDVVETMAIAMALQRYSLQVIHATVGTPIDVQVRTPEDAGAIAAALWSELCRFLEMKVEELKKMPDAPKDLIERLEMRTRLAPSDPALRPDLKPVEPQIRREPMTLAEAINAINAGGEQSGNN